MEEVRKQAASLLLLIAQRTQDASPFANAQSIERDRAIFQAVVEAAKSKGFARSAVLNELLTKKAPTETLLPLCQEVLDVAGVEPLLCALQVAGREIR